MIGIKGMNIPDNCKKCSFSKMNDYGNTLYDYSWSCIITEKDITESIKYRYKDYYCPICKIEETEDGKIKDEMTILNDEIIKMFDRFIEKSNIKEELLKMEVENVHVSIKMEK